MVFLSIDKLKSTVTAQKLIIFSCCPFSMYYYITHNIPQHTELNDDADKFDSRRDNKLTYQYL